MSLSLSRKRRLREAAQTASADEDITVADENEPPTTSFNAKRSRNQNNTEEIFQPEFSQISHLTTSCLTAAPQRCGKVLRMHLTNFMCHGNLLMELHPRINFLVGANGSGKSSIMAALVVGLGSRAKETNRSSSIKQLIKHGENSAKIEITLANEGPGSFEHETYGDSITVTRTITQSGSSNYTIKNAHGYIVSKRIDDLNRILLYHNIQVDNPVFVLNQDNAREFLKDLDPVKNYKLFLKATQIETITEKLNDCLHQHRDHVAHMQCYKKKIRCCEAEIKELEQRLQTIHTFANLKYELLACEQELVWILVAHEENALEEVQVQIDEAIANSENLKGLVTSKTDMETRLRNDIRNFESEVAEKGAFASTEHEKFQALNNKFMQLELQRLNTDTEINLMKDKNRHLQTQINDLNVHINQSKQISEEDINAMRQSNEARVEDLKAQSDELKAMQDAAKRDIIMFSGNRQKNLETLDAIKKKRIAVEQNIQRINSRVATLNQNANSDISVYGPEMFELVSEIQKLNRAGRFSEIPRGPVGRYIKVPNNKFRDVVEHVIGKVVLAFIVNNGKDRVLLEGLIKRICPRNRPTIITTKFIKQVFDVRRGCVHPIPQGTNLLMNEISCSDPVVMNYLIDAFKVEKVLLTDNKDAARNCTADVERTPRNLQRVFVAGNPGLEYMPAPKYRVYTIDIRKSQYLQIDVKHHIENLQREKVELTKSIRDSEKQIAALQIEIDEDINRINEKRTLMGRQTTKLRELEEKITEIQEYEYPDSSQIDLLNREKAEVEQRIKSNEEKLRAKIAEGQAFERAKSVLSDKVAQQETIIKNIEEEMNDINKKIGDLRIKILNLTESFQQNQRKLAEVNDQLRELEGAKVKIQKFYQVALEKAQKRGERIATERTEDAVKQQISEIKIRMEEGKKVTDTPEELSSMISAKREVLNSDKLVYDKLKASLNMLGNSLRMRFSFLKKLKQHMVLILQYSFDFVLKARHFLGSVEVDHTEKMLKLSVIPRDKHVKTAVSSTRALSGGERSYSTVAFLIALWSCVDHPFYFLDEYDVFTDVVNRDALTSLLINEGRTRANRQYTFLTPQDLALNADDITKIHRFSEPERR